MNTNYTYSDVLIVPQYSEIESRRDVNLTTYLRNVPLSLPVISANMKNITGESMANEMCKCGGMGILHRFCTIEQNIQMFKNVSLNNNRLGVSIGVKPEERERFIALYNAGARIFCIDVAHGHHILVKNMLEFINKTVSTPSKRNELVVIAGNIATKQACLDLIHWGADVVKVGIGPSPVCRTRYNTGVGVPQLSALEDVYSAKNEISKHFSIIADGGISCIGDIAKALRYADQVMIGSLISGCDETPGEIFRNENGKLYKVYGGSASGENKGENNFIEGIIKTVDYQGHVSYIMKEVRDGLRSAFSYVGARNHCEYQQKCVFNHLSGGAQNESRIK